MFFLVFVSLLPNNGAMFHLLYKSKMISTAFQWHQPQRIFTNATKTMMSDLVSTNQTLFDSKQREEVVAAVATLQNLNKNSRKSSFVQTIITTAVEHELLVNQKPRGSTIFYNIYINASEPENGIRIIKEQTRQVFQYLTTAAASSQNHNHTSFAKDDEVPVLYYNMIGTNYTERFCPDNMTCTLLKFYEQAYEDVTLQSLHDYCIAHPHNVVYYLHNKGSLTKSSYRERHRRYATRVVMSSTSMALLLEHPRHYNCNVVGTTWEPYPYWHFDGNFWLAKCDYVRKLLPPKDVSVIRSAMIQRLLHRDHKKLGSPYYCLAAFLGRKYRNLQGLPLKIQHALGNGRFFFEGWISSHPDVAPCDQIDSAFTTTALDFTSSKTRQLYGQQGMLYKYEWFRMHGRLYEFYQLYGRSPSNTSFFWKFYQGTEVPQLPDVCQQGHGRNLSSYFETV